ncbi:MAG: aminotransferase class I/II-fold pyridoxal phosphate-dependent enzyme [Clostridia bacterium]|nr:aminotransferase class I/II-fold pyridoxal phosphate-dependent enzyme [Clostridia bacterium]
MTYQSMSRQELESLRDRLLSKYNEYKADGIKLDMARGKPDKQQLDISEEILGLITKNEQCIASDGTDCRNYGGLDGLASAKELFADVFGLRAENIILGGNSSLNMMYDTVARAYTFGFCDSERPWCREEKIKFLCPSPGYDRHFAICELFGIEMITVAMNDDGPDMETVKKYVESDSAVRGIWCVPKYSNPTGIVYSDDVVRAFAALKPAARDFRIFWDNAYAIHDFGENIPILNILEECEKTGRPNMPIMFASTSKITFPGSGVALMSASLENLNYMKKQLSIQTIGPDKINQLRHVAFFKNKQGMMEHMKRHADILRPKFETVVAAFEKELSGTGIASWTTPRGGYFISFESLPGCAPAIYKLALDAGLTLTNVGATYPYGKDPKDSNIRIAPSFPDVESLKLAVERFIVCVKLASVEKLLSEK